MDNEQMMSQTRIYAHAVANPSTRLVCRHNHMLPSFRSFKMILECSGWKQAMWGMEKEQGTGKQVGKVRQGKACKRVGQIQLLSCVGRAGATAE